MVTAAFRFHDELNDFLPRERRAVEFHCECARAATAKHMIEALGVPHTEVGRVFLNGAAASLSRLLSDGDRVEVWPHRPGEQLQPAAALASGALAAGSAGSAGPAASHAAVGAHGPAPRFVADAHLGGLARLLRMAGFDTLYDNNILDEEVEALSANEGRIALTRDRELLKRSGVEQGCYVRALKPAGQLAEIFRRLNLAPQARPFTLCLSCNAPLRAVGKAEIHERLPPSVQRAHDEFLTCEQCHGVFWKGSHWRRMSDLLMKIS
jgi:uncharacterized protein with PIN domain